MLRIDDNIHSYPEVGTVLAPAAYEYPLSRESIKVSKAPIDIRDSRVATEAPIEIRNSEGVDPRARHGQPERALKAAESRRRYKNTSINIIQ